jgi:hypothetical protein
MLNPGQALRPEMYLWSDRPPHKREAWPVELTVQRDARVVLDAGHKVEWGWGVTLYLVTKGIAGGVAMLAPFAAALGLQGFAAKYLPELVALIFIGLTGLLLVEDLKKPLAFIRLFTRPNWNSWLVKGAWVINVFVGLIIASLALRWFGFDGAANAVRWGGAVAGAAVAGYTAFLFGQCEGRDLWQSWILLPHLHAQAVLCGAVTLMPFDAHHGPMLVFAAIAAAIHMLLAVVERYRAHPTENATQGAAFLSVITIGPLRAWRDGLIIGVGLTIILTFTLPEIAFIPAIVGLLMYEHAFIRAGQLPPLS